MRVDANRSSSGSSFDYPTPNGAARLCVIRGDSRPFRQQNR